MEGSVVGYLQGLPVHVSGVVALCHVVPRKCVGLLCTHLGLPQGGAVSVASVCLGEIPLKLARFLFCQIWFGKCEPLFVLCFYESACFTSCPCKWLTILQKQLTDSPSLLCRPLVEGNQCFRLSPSLHGGKAAF